MLQGSLPLWWFYWDRTHTHILTYTRSIWNKNFLQGETQRELKCQGVFLAFTKLTADLFVNVSKMQLVFSLRERRQERRIGLGWPSWLPAPRRPAHCEAWKLILRIGFWLDCSPSQRRALQKSLSGLWKQHLICLRTHTGPSASLSFSLLAFPSPRVALTACEINYQSCHIFRC